MCKLVFRNEAGEEKVIWENPPELGFFGIKLRKQMYEERLAEEVVKRMNIEKEGTKMENLQEMSNEELVNKLIELARYEGCATTSVVPPSWEKAEEKLKEQEAVKEELLRRLSKSVRGYLKT
ncbi:hypothetical protein KJ853_04630 [Patescibacteria group bacterium]|nr:hypothetical protein [Patescibacteria group bacterium]